MKHVKTTLDIKIANAVKVYSELRKYPGLTKSQLAQQVDLSFASVSKMCGYLEDLGLVSVVENVSSTGGRKAAEVTFNPEGAYTVAVDIHHTQHIYMSLVNLRNEVKETLRFEVAPEDTPETIVPMIREAFEKLNSGSKVPILGIGVGISAVQEPNTGLLLQSTNPVFERVNLRDLLSEEFPGVLVTVDNDANLAGMADRSAQASNRLFLFFTEGVGLGIMIGGKLYRGSNGFAGELGHLKVSGVDTPCKCGGKGCLRTVATLESIARDLGEADRFKEEPLSTAYARRLAQRYREEDRAVIERVDLTAAKIGEVMAELFDLFNPEEIVLGGNMGELFKLTNPIIRGQCRRLSNLAGEVDLKIRFLDRPTYELVMAGIGEKMYQHWLENVFPAL